MGTPFATHPWCVNLAHHSFPFPDLLSKQKNTPHQTSKRPRFQCSSKIKHKKKPTYSYYLWTPKNHEKNDGVFKASKTMGSYNSSGVSGYRVRLWIKFSNHSDLITLQGTNISHLGKRKIIFKSALGWDMLVPRRVFTSASPVHQSEWKNTMWPWHIDGDSS